MNNKDNAYALIAWIKRDQAERREFAEIMTRVNFKNDVEFEKLLQVVIKKWEKVKYNDKTFIMSLVQWRQENRVWSAKQRSAITTLYLKYAQPIIS